MSTELRSEPTGLLCPRCGGEIENYSHCGINLTVEEQIGFEENYGVNGGGYYQCDGCGAYYQNDEELDIGMRMCSGCERRVTEEYICLLHTHIDNEEAITRTINKWAMKVKKLISEKKGDIVLIYVDKYSLISDKEIIEFADKYGNVENYIEDVFGGVEEL